MTSINFYIGKKKASLYSVRLLICVFGLLFFNSCKQKPQQASGYSKAFVPVLDTVSKLFVTNRLAIGLHYLDSAMATISNPTIDEKFRALSFHYIYYNKEKGDNKRCLAYADTMLSLAKKDINDKMYAANFAEASFGIGDAYFALQQYNKAYQNYYNGYLVALAHLDNNALADYSYRMGMIMYKMGNYKLAANYFKKSYSLNGITRDAFADFYRKQELLDNIALSYKHNNMPDSALVYFDKARDYITQNGFQYTDRLKMIDVALAVVYGNKAEVLILQGKDDEAEKLLKQSITINLRKSNDNNDAELSEIKLAKLYYDHHNDAALFNLLTQIQGQLDSIKNDVALADWNRLMSQYYQRKNDLPKALKYLFTYNTLNDSNTHKLNLLRESDINKQLDTYEKQEKIDELSNKNKYQAIYIAVISIFCSMASIIIFLVYRNWTRSKKDVLKVNELYRQINEQNTVLESALNELQNNNREKDRILRAVAHDLRNPLGGIASLTSLMAEDDECTEDQREQIIMIKQTAVNVLEMINEILEAANINSAQLNMEMVDINLLVNNSVNLLKFKAEEKGQSIIVTPLSRIIYVYISREKIWRVINNLISNAIKFSPSGAAISVNIEESDGNLIISVADNGIGIPDNIRDKVFNMFTTAQRPGTAGEKSFGLGLSICKQIIDRFNGKIWFESRLNGGTTFYISLPIPAEQPQSTQKVTVPIT